MAFHHGTMRKYTAALLDFFNGLEVQYNDSTSTTVVRSIPVQYTTKEKSHLMDSYTDEQLSSGNMNVLPRANLSFTSLTKIEQRQMNKNNKIAKKMNVDSYDYMFNSVPYEFNYEIAILCRGMNEATQIVEQIAPMFNPILNIDIWDAHNLDEPTRIPVKLLDIDIESEDYEEYSSNLCTVSCGISVTGNLYPPIQTVKRIKQFKMNMNENLDLYNKRIINNWDVNNSGALINNTTNQINNSNYPPIIIDITSTSPVIIGTNNITAIWKDVDNTIDQLTFDWVVLQGTATIQGNLDNAVLTASVPETIEVQVTVTDPFGNFSSLSKIFNT